MDNWTLAALTPRYLRASAPQWRSADLPWVSDAGRVTAPLSSILQINQLTAKEARALNGKQIDELAQNRLTSAVGTRWLASAQEWPRSPRCNRMAARTWLL